MGDMILLLAVMIFLVGEARAVDKVFNSFFKLGTDSNLTFSNKTWNDTIFVVCDINFKYKQCKIALSTDKRIDTCNDGKSLRLTPKYGIHLHIPNFSTKDEGFYSCSTAYKGSSDTCNITVSIIVPPSLSYWIEWKNKDMVAVCKAERGKPAARIIWSREGNSSLVEAQTSSDGFVTVESRLELPEGTDTENLTCSVTHPYWESEKVLAPKLQRGLNFIVMCIVSVLLILVFLAGFLLFMHKKPVLLRFRQRNDSSTSKSPPPEDAEEVEPYASYVQRVNSIYNS
ncbi:cell surface glycoprotein CD200 receptor 1 [Aulostomus maculatus]